MLTPSGRAFAAARRGTERRTPSSRSFSACLCISLIPSLFFLLSSLFSLPHVDLSRAYMPMNGLRQGRCLLSELDLRNHGIGPFSNPGRATPSVAVPIANAAPPGSTNHSRLAVPPYIEPRAEVIRAVMLRVSPCSLHRLKRPTASASL